MNAKAKAKSKGNKRVDEKIVKEVIRKYGEVIDLRETPYVLIEILRKYQLRLTPDDGGLPPGGVPTPPSPGPALRVVDMSVLLKAILELSREVKAIKRKLGS